MKLVFLLLIVLATAQICPYCAPGACTTTTHGLSNCSKCWTGALVKVQTVVLPPLSPFASDTIGICQLCPRGCITCNYAVIAPAMANAFQGINCTSCERAHTYNYATGFCSKCSANCIRCECIMAGCSIIDCLACRPGYSLGKSVDNGHACVKNTNGQGNGHGRRLSNYEQS